MFKGTNVAINNLEVVGAPTGARVKFRVSFTDDGGVVHGTMAHALEVSADDRLRLATKELVDALVAYSKKIHFGQEEVTHPQEGIAEALREKPDPSDDIAGQG